MTWTSETAKREAEQILDFEQQLYENWQKQLGPYESFSLWSSKCWDSIDKLKKKHWDAHGLEK